MPDVGCRGGEEFRFFAMAASKVTELKRIGVLTGGGDCPGMNAVLRAVTKTAINRYSLEVIGIKDGFAGLVEGSTRHLSYDDVSNILTQGGTILGTSNRADPFHYPLCVGKKLVTKDLSSRAVDNYRRLGLGGLICIGGDGTLTIASRLSKAGVRLVGVPKTIDNDLGETDVTFGFQSALSIATEAVDRIHSTAQSHHRIMIVEVMGRYAGWLALETGLASGGDIILIPEIPYEIDVVCRVVRERHGRGRRFSIIVIAEGARQKGRGLTVKKRVKGSPDPIRLGGVANLLAADIEKRTGLETRVTVLGHLQRGGTPCAFDRILATRFGAEAVRLLAGGKHGSMVSLRGNDIRSVKIEKAVEKLRKVSPHSELVGVAKLVGASFGV